MSRKRGRIASLVAACVGLSALLATVVFAQSCFDYAEAPGWLASQRWAPDYASSFISLRGLTWLGEGDTLLFLAADQQEFLRVLDARDPHNPVEIGGVALGSGVERYDVAVRGRYAYAGAYGSLGVLSLADPAAPSLVRTLALPPGGRLALDGDLLLRLESDTLRVMDVAQPELPVTLACLGLGERGFDVALADGVAYVGLADGVASVDLAVPSQPALAGRQAGVGYVGAVVVKGGHLFTTGARLTLFDLAEPRSPQPLGRLEGIGGDELAIDGDTVLAAGNFDFWLCDASTPSLPRLLVHGGSPRGAFTTGAVLRNGVARLAFTDLNDGTELQAWRVGSAPAPAPLAIRPAPADLAPHQELVALLGDGRYAHLLYANPYDLEDGPSRLIVLDLGDPGAPLTLADLAIPAVGRATLGKVGDLLLIQGGGLTVVDVSAPAQPVVRGAVRLLPPGAEQNYWQPQAWGDRVLVAAGAQTAWGYPWSLVDLADPEAPVLLGPLPAELQRGALARSGDVACVVRGDSLLTFDVADPWHPVALGAVAPGAWLQGPVEIVGQVAYCSAWWMLESGLLAIGIADPSAPEVVGRLSLSTSAWYKVAVGTRLYVGGELESVQAVDIADPTRLAVVGTPWPLDWNMTFAACTAGLLHGDGLDLRLLSFDCAPPTAVDPPATGAAPPRPVTLLAPHPNPFNPVVRIPFVLARAQRTRVCVYDLAGRRVATLADGVFGAGRQELVWRGLDARGAAVASGSYVVRVEGEAGRDGRRITLIR
ncbi:MAG: LVIVD repeat-containing protein [Candidatus Krumholzibacteriia bacterium]